MILAPRGRDAAVAAALLQEIGVPAITCTDLDEFQRCINDDAAFALLTEEAVAFADLKPLAALLSAQPPWSDLPFVIMTLRDGGPERNARATRQSELLGNVTFLERPFHPATFLSIARTALRSRQRQYEARARMRELHESKERFRALAEGIPQLVFRVRGSGEATWVSPQWMSFTGLSEEASLGMGWLEVIHPEDRPRTVAAWAEAEILGALSVDHRLRRAADGTFRWFQTRALPVRDGSGAEHPDSVAQWLGTSTDIEDQMRAREVLAHSREELEALVNERTAELMAAEETLRQVQKMEAVGQLTGGIAHDFNNMLQGIGASLDLIGRRIEQGRAQEARRLLGMARETLDRAAGLTRRLLAFARRQRLEPKPVDPDRLILDMEDLIGRTMGPEVEVELNLRDGTRTVLCDANELESAILNLCINARDAMHGGGRLTIGMADQVLRADDVTPEEVKAGAYVVISVADTGAGMPPDVLERAFEPFFTTKPVGAGTGLGLSQTYGFARQSGGTLRVESAPGQGTTARLLLPAHALQPSGGEPTITRVPERAEAGATVLLVDDEAAVRATAAERLRELGYQALEAPDGPSALNLLEEGPQLDLLITDVGLPRGMNGRQLAEAVRERSPGVPILFITGYATDTLPPGAEVISKPFALDDLARRAQVLIAASFGGVARQVSTKCWPTSKVGRARTPSW
ncbi:MAG: response regulator, partial [Acetobacteraceae bacterium]|nr:response regulator [Acetobacteraceae bacterium]